MEETQRATARSSVSGRQWNTGQLIHGLQGLGFWDRSGNIGALINKVLEGSTLFRDHQGMPLVILPTPKNKFPTLATLTVTVPALAGAS